MTHSVKSGLDSFVFSVNLTCFDYRAKLAIQITIDIRSMFLTAPWYVLAVPRAFYELVWLSGVWSCFVHCSS